MRIILVSFLIAAASVAPIQSSVKVLTWNIQPECERVKKLNLQTQVVGPGYQKALNFIKSQAEGTAPFDFFGFQESAYYEYQAGRWIDGSGGSGANCSRSPLNKESILQRFTRENQYYDMIKTHPGKKKNSWYGVQVVYNTKKWDKVANSKSFKAETTGVRGRPCISGLFKRRTDGKVGMVTSCHIDHCGSGTCDPLKNDLSNKLQRQKLEMMRKANRDRKLRKDKVDFEIVMGDFNELGRDIWPGKRNMFWNRQGCKLGHGGCVPGFVTPNGGNVKTLYNQEVDRILYNYAGASTSTPLTIETFRVSMTGTVTSCTGSGNCGSVNPKAEVSDHRPRKIILPN